MPHPLSIHVARHQPPCHIFVMPMPIPPRSLPSDFSERLAELRKLAEERGHPDVGYLLDLAGQLSGLRQNPAALGPASWEGELLLGLPVEAELPLSV